MQTHLSVQALRQYPAVNENKVNALLAEETRRDVHKLIVLDDDPTGVQTVHGVTVYTDWTLDSIRQGFAEPNKAFFILTNSRAMTAEETTRAHREIAHNVATVARETDWRYLFLSRSDSTLRGHYPLETRILKECIEAEEERRVDGEILCPFFKEGGRFTLNDVHYVRRGEELIPAAETEFAKDYTFGYRHSSIPEYVEEKTEGAYKAEDVISIPLEMLRALDWDGIKAKLLSAGGFEKICLNAIDTVDLKIAAIAIYRAIAENRMFLFRTASGLVQVLSGIQDRALLTREEMVRKETKNGGLVIVGSHTQKTTAQLNELLKLKGTVAIPFNSDLVLKGEDAFEGEIRRCLKLEETTLANGGIPVVYTCRNALSLNHDTKESALCRSVRIGEGVQSLVGRLTVEPNFVIAKGGITSSDVGVKALQVSKATVIGQIRPGVPVWRLGEQSKFPQMPYVIFPGNVGSKTTLREAVEILTR